MRQLSLQQFLSVKGLPNQAVDLWDVHFGSHFSSSTDQTEPRFSENPPVAAWYFVISVNQSINQSVIDQFICIAQFRHFKVLYVIKTQKMFLCVVFNNTANTEIMAERNKLKEGENDD